ncbi:MAG TPA: hypothetical protein VKE73_08120 [Myxococcota bacterium]|nr:hypothetical protein [Myxococcota bacterium]
MCFACARNHDGKINLVVYYQDGQRVRSEEDTDFDGRMDTWEYYGPDANGTPVVRRVERDTKGTGRPDTFETYAQQNGSTVIVKREEDTDGDGQIDEVSLFQNGELVRRERAAPSPHWGGGGSGGGFRPLSARAPVASGPPR